MSSLLTLGHIRIVTFLCTSDNTEGAVWSDNVNLNALVENLRQFIEGIIVFKSVILGGKWSILRSESPFVLWQRVSGAVKRNLRP